MLSFPYKSRIKRPPIYIGTGCFTSGKEKKKFKKKIIIIKRRRIKATCIGGVCAFFFDAFRRTFVSAKFSLTNIIVLVLAIYIYIRIYIYIQGRVVLYLRFPLWSCQPSILLLLSRDRIIPMQHKDFLLLIPPCIHIRNPAARILH